MRYKKLFIIGNGFDLFHKLKTSYSDFCLFVRNSRKKLYEFLECYIELETNSRGLWSNFENDLRTFDHKAFYDDHNHTDIFSDSFKLSDMYGVEDELTEKAWMMVDDLSSALYDWINEIEYPNKEDASLPLDPNALFLTFNYTSTLTRLYTISEDNILHIHHSVESNEDDLIFGHGTIIKEKPELDEEGNANYPTPSFSNAEGASKLMLTHFYKDTKNKIKENKKFFDKLCNIDQIIVLGHSINNIDLPYFEHINKKARNAKWTISYYTDSEPNRMREALLEAGLNDEISFIEIGKIPYTEFNR